MIRILLVLMRPIVLMVMIVVTVMLMVLPIVANGRLVFFVVGRTIITLEPGVIIRVLIS